MKKDLIAFDMDDVVNKMRLETSRVFTEMSGKVVPVEEWSKLCPQFLYGVDFCPETMMKGRIIEDCLPEEDASETFKMLSERGFQTAIITARGWHDRGVEATLEWLDQHGIEVDHLHVVSMTETKFDVFSKIQKDFYIKAFIDDQVKYLEQAVNHEAVEKVFAFNRPWNQNLEFEGNIHRVHSLLEFAKNI